MKRTSTFTLVRKATPDADSGRTRPSSALSSSTPTGLSAKVSVRPSDRLVGGVARVVKNKNVSSKPGISNKQSTWASERFRALGESAVRRAIGAPLGDVYTRQDENFKATLRSMLGSSAKELSTSPDAVVAGKVKRITEQLARSERVIKVGVLDLGAWIDLSMLIERLNVRQGLFTLFEVVAPIPGGLVKTPEGLSQWLASHGEPRRKPTTLQPHMVFDEFHVAADDIRTKMGLDLLVGVTPYRVAGSDGGTLFWNHFSATAHGSILLSVADLHEYAVQAGRPFEAAVGVLLVSALFVAIVKDLDFHVIDTGCLFDYNERRVSLVDSIKALRIDDACLSKLDPTERESLTSMLGVLKRMKRTGSR